MNFKAMSLVSLCFDNANVISNLAPFYPGKRDEGWWLVIGEHKTNSLLAIKHVSLQQKKKIALELVPQKVSLKIFSVIILLEISRLVKQNLFCI